MNRVNHATSRKPIFDECSIESAATQFTPQQAAEAPSSTRVRRRTGGLQNLVQIADTKATNSGHVDKANSGLSLSSATRPVRGSEAAAFNIVSYDKLVGGILAGGLEDELLSGDPWEGCEDIIGEDLTEWFLDPARRQRQARGEADLLEWQVRCVRSIVDQMLGVRQSGQSCRGWTMEELRPVECDCQAEKLSLNSVSTRSSLGTVSILESASLPSSCGSLSLRSRARETERTASASEALHSSGRRQPTHSEREQPSSSQMPLRGWGVTPLATLKGPSSPAGHLAAPEPRPRMRPCDAPISDSSPSRHLLEEDLEFFLRG
eukprot:CAMPEP_0170415990 /NCGR_PEP_ID=MMETSP0117_2-20130122/32914_1 /TAXON_ID=400756 /ORGANISM="Durinskia baltica, Strain CSIRO CS-38" /LENGTH=319 /DNA_ID=CAMNT_0010674019 /DNA_START=181 /DNA_END=1136 /DNA_ORIENTATION=-